MECDFCNNIDVKNVYHLLALHTKCDIDSYNNLAKFNYECPKCRKLMHTMTFNLVNKHD